MPTISVIIPAYNAARTLPACLDAVARSSHAPAEIIVVDDASQDETAATATRAGVRVLTLPQNEGAARAKNRGAEMASGEVLFFLDSDVVCGPDAVAVVEEQLSDPTVAGIVGLLDPAIPYGDLASQFKNLWMRYTYLRLATPDSTRSGVGVFYTSAAAVRRRVFRALGGFDEHYVDASIVEDNEFGQRVWAEGKRLKVDARLSVVHLRPYSLGQLLRTDFLRARALTMLRLRKWGKPFFTSVPGFYQLAVPTLFGALGLGLIALGFGLFKLPLATEVAGGALALVFLFYAVNLPLLRFMAAQRGLRFALQCALFLAPDVFAVGLGMLRALADWASRQRY